MSSPTTDSLAAESMPLSQSISDSILQAHLKCNQLSLSLHYIVSQPLQLIRSFI